MPPVRGLSLSNLRDILAAIFLLASLMMGEGCGMLALEMADYVLTGSRSKLQAVVPLNEGLADRQGGEKSHCTVALPLVDDCLLQGG